MDLFLAACQGVGLSLALGMVAGALAGAMGPEGDRPSPVGLTALLIAAIAAAYLFGDALEGEDHLAWPGMPVGAALATGAFVVIRSVVAGASQRAGEGGSRGAIAGLAVLAALVLAGLSLTPASPVSLLVAVALAYLAFARRRRAGEKYEGLRILR